MDNGFSYSDFLMYQLEQLKRIYYNSDSPDREDYVNREMHFKWQDLFTHAPTQELKALIIGMMTPEDILDGYWFIKTSGYDDIDITELAKKLPAQKVEENWEQIIRYGGDKEALFDYVRWNIDRMNFDSFKKWVERGIDVEKLYYTYRFSYLLTGVSGWEGLYHDFIKALKGLKDTKTWVDVEKDVKKYDYSEKIIKDMVEKSDRWVKFGFNPKKYLKEYFDTKSPNIIVFGPKRAFGNYASIDDFMKKADLKSFLERYAEYDGKYFAKFVADYKEFKGSTDELTKRVIKIVKYKPKYVHILYELLVYDENNLLDAEKIARSIAYDFGVVEIKGLRMKIPENVGRKKKVMKTFRNHGVSEDTLKEIFGK